MINGKHTIWPQDFRMLLKQTNDQNMQCKLRSQVGWSVLWKKTEKTYMQRTLCQVFPAEGKLPVGGFAARKILPCKLCDNCGRSVCIHVILSGYILCYLVLTEAPWTSSQGWKRHTSNSWKNGLAGLNGKRMDRNLSLFRPLGQIYQ